MLMMELALRKSLMVISTTDILLYAKYISPLYNIRVSLLLFARKLHGLPTFEHTSAH